MWIFRLPAILKACRFAIVSVVAMTVAPGASGLSSKAEADRIVVRTSATDHWIALVGKCRDAKYPDCPKECLKDASRQRCYPPSPSGSWVKSIPNMPDYCEGYYPDCPDYCVVNKELKKCDPKTP